MEENRKAEAMKKGKKQASYIESQSINQSSNQSINQIFVYSYYF